MTCPLLFRTLWRVGPASRLWPEDLWFHRSDRPGLHDCRCDPGDVFRLLPLAARAVASAVDRMDLESIDVARTLGDSPPRLIFASLCPVLERRFFQVLSWPSPDPLENSRQSSCSEATCPDQHRFWPPMFLQKLKKASWPWQ